jgi:hypothetical protein
MAAYRTRAHSATASWWFWLTGREIRVSALSATWLRAHEADWNKHDVDV